MKVERVSYDVITPSAARAIFSAILWKPAIRWRILKIEVLKPIRWASIRRNEVSSVANLRSGGIFIEDSRTQRAGLILRDVKYRLHAEFDFIPPEKRAKVVNPVPDWLTDDEEKELYQQAEANVTRLDEKESKYAAMFERRAKKGQCFTQPYLGCREFSCDFRLVEKAADDEVIADTRDLGFMLYDLDYADPDNVKPMFFRANMVNGVIMVPDVNSDQVFK
jgi:CRISPR-associated protein Cas5d